MHRRTWTSVLGVAASAAVVATFAAQPATAQRAPATKAVKQAPAASSTTKSDELPNPLEDKRRALKQTAISDLLNGKGKVETRNGSTVMKVSSTKAPQAQNGQGVVKAQAATTDQYVELARQKTDHIFVILAEFGNKRDAKFPDEDVNPAVPGPTKFDGPLHNQIPQPDRSKDNSTVWQKDYNQKHYQDLYFGTGGAPGSGGATESVRQYFERQSSGRYSINGTVTDWVKVPYNEARYGRSTDVDDNDPNVCADIVCDNTWALVRDAANTWFKGEVKRVGEDAAKKELQALDAWDRYDVDNDGNFNEPDGYIDHFQIVHAGGDEADGDPIQGEDAVWSHRWYAYGTDVGKTGPAQGKQGGTEIGDSGVWIGDYTIQPENGGMSVFAHEYTHDLGLPDLYDTAGGENSVNWWSLMSQSREAAPNDQGIGTRASDLGAWDKLQLGWLNYDLTKASENRKIDLGPAEYNSAKPQAAVVVLPKKQVTNQLVKPYAGSKSWWSGTGDGYTATMSRSVTVPKTGGTLTAQANYNIEKDYDYAYVEVKPAGSSTWTSIPGTGTDANKNNGLTGDSGGKWTPVTFDLSSYKGQTIDLRVRYTTDGATQGNDPALPPGLFLDDIAVPGLSTPDGAENPPNGWTLVGFSSVGSSVTQAFDNYYIAANRTYTSFDKYLQSGPYNFGFANTLPDKVEHFPYQDGLLVDYWDTSQTDNNTSVHPGQGLILPVDSHPRALLRLDGTLWRPRVSGYDAPFGLQQADSLDLHVNGQLNHIYGQPAVPVFRDDRSYWDASQPGASVEVPNTGTLIRVLSQSGTSMSIKVGQTS